MQRAVHAARTLQQRIKLAAGAQKRCTRRGGVYCTPQGLMTTRCVDCDRE